MSSREKIPLRYFTVHEKPQEGTREACEETRSEVHDVLDSRRILWQPSLERIAESNTVAFLRFLGEKYGSDAPCLDRLYDWSVECPRKFWRSFFDFSKVIHTGDPTRVLTYVAPAPHPSTGSGQAPSSHLQVGEVQRMIDARWFPDVQLNFAENLLQHAERQPEKKAIAFFGEDGRERHLTYKELQSDAVRFSRILDACGVVRGDRVVALMPNIPETVSAMLATTARGAIWSSVSPEFGADAIVDRFGQLEPKVLIASDGHIYRGKMHSALEKVRAVTERIPSIEHTIVVPYVGNNCSPLSCHSGRGDGEEGPSPCTLSPCPSPFAKGEGGSGPLSYTRLPFNHPLFILFSSGTDDKAKCIIHSAGGTLLNQCKQHRLHTDLTERDTLFFNTRTSWMMWNSLVSALGIGARIVLYDGDPLAREGRMLFDIAEKERITVFGTSAGFLSEIEKRGLRPRETHDLSSVRTILSTGSRLFDSQFDYVYAHVHPTVQLASTSGGTEIMGAFATSSPVHPVRRGELQARSLGYKVEVFDEEGNAVPPGVRGELVCTAPFPSQPLGFWSDPEHERYLGTYFEKYGPTVWYHGDEAELTPSGGMVIYGRSDDRFKRGGIWIESESIATQAKKISEVLDAGVVGHGVERSNHVLLFVVLHEGQELTEELAGRIRAQIRTCISPYQVPDVILAVPALPHTQNGKLSLSAIRAVVHGREAKNAEALRNPESLVYFRDRPELAL